MVRLRAVAREGADAARAMTARTPVSPVPGSLPPRAERVRTEVREAPPVTTTPPAPAPVAKRSNAVRFGIPVVVATAIAMAWYAGRSVRPGTEAVLVPRADSIAHVVAPQPPPDTAIRAITPVAPPAAPTAAPPPASPPAPRTIVPAVIPPAVSVAKPPPAPPPAPPRDPARAEVEAAIDDYATALESRNLAKVRLAYPGLTPAQAQELGTWLLKTKDLRARLRVTTFEHDGDRADASVEGTYEYFDLKSGRSEREPVTLQAVLESSGGSWRLVSIQ
jgi:hypothetical protein